MGRFGISAGATPPPQGGERPYRPYSQGPRMRQAVLGSR